MKASDFFQLPASLAHWAEHFSPNLPPWEWLGRIAGALDSWNFGSAAHAPAGVRIEGAVYIHPTAKVAPGAIVSGPAWIGPETEVRPGAWIRGQVIAGARCVLGHASEYKNCLLLDEVATPHYNYVGDSILGNRAHLGAGAVCSNLRLDRAPVVVRGPEGDHETGLRKLGALVGDDAEVGCNAVLNPGALLGPRSLVMPALAFGGYLPPAMLAKGRAAISLVPRRG